MEHQLKQADYWLAATLRGVADAVIVTDARGRITHMSPVAEMLTGWRQTDAVDQDVTRVMNFIDAATREPVVNPVLRALREGREVSLPPNTVLEQQGRHILIEDTATPIWDDAGRLTGGLLVFKDVTQRQRAESELQRINRELQARNAELDAFARNVAHDLKNPINMIIGYVELLMQDELDMRVDQRQKSLETIERTARKLNNIVDEILLLAGIRNMEAPFTPLDMAQVVAEAQQRVMDLIIQHQAEIIQPSSWPAACGYAPWVEEIWANYLSNAIKHGGRPPRVELGGESQADGTARFWMRDNGPGLSLEQQAQLFKPFTQLAQTRARGYGLGLSIVQQIAAKLGGQVGVESSGDPGLGCTFYFTLPAAKPALDQP